MLEDLLQAEVYDFFTLFVRIGAFFMLAPALGEQSFPRPARLAFALLVTGVMVGPLAPTLPPPPAGFAGLSWLVIRELIVGLTLALVGQILMGALHVTGTIQGFMNGLAVAEQFDPTQGTQAALTATFMRLIGVTLIFVTDLHHLMLEALYDSYTLLPPTRMMPVGDYLTMIVDQISHMFRLGLQLAAPFFVYALVFYTALGISARLLPQFQIFFLAMPINILLGFVVLAVVLPGVMMAFLAGYEDQFQRFVR
ncbi:flagellar biosynthetic protein FliR [Rhodothalassium salexigens DSM 2132]|uniref:Flagellar biosynthetic protein FliR n=1 Tax=Rhodothalassium salexigens DSM 2132 TaxID=1188247 RepID=A0A4R2PBQ1_RHOSA|nr:flagellar biosynthetic protein FliR [Rhodothalassium salexigens]MBB4212299.1 flagellar biosynthetic protein FliR [Rhodothalassium salexigens DSM 2132]MBK1638343.1 flagellar biosynthetic protein FliR [Rhodothalassium salexigens DSM 2132]TCP32550.1 flagellar biosynthetic protein FliR [Rhodothalassium salexigens DSM 2132]